VGNDFSKRREAITIHNLQAMSAQPLVLPSIKMCEQAYPPAFFKINKSILDKAAAAF
jgi:hypothetical protein